MNFNTDLVWKKLEAMPPEKREEIILERLRKQIDYAYSSTPVYKAWMGHAGFRAKDIKTMKDFRKRVPMLTKNKLRSLGMYELLPAVYQNAVKFTQRDIAAKDRICHMFSTSGTTGVPTNVFYTVNDWSLTVEALRYAAFREVPLEDCKVFFHGFHQGHIGGPLLTDTWHSAGSIVIPRHFRAEDEAALKQIKSYGCDAIMAPPHAGSKGGAIETMLNLDKDNIIGSQIKTVFYAGAPMKDELWLALRELGIKHIRSFYGSSEALPVAVDCNSNDGYHLMYNLALVEVIDLKTGEHVASGERGRVIVTALDRQGSQFIRYDLGDEAKYLDDKCSCGRSTPRLKDVKRVSDIERTKTGCTIWE